MPYVKLMIPCHISYHFNYAVSNYVLCYHQLTACAFILLCSSEFVIRSESHTIRSRVRPGTASAHHQPHQPSSPQPTFGEFRCHYEQHLLCLSSINTDFQELLHIDILRVSMTLFRSRPCTGPWSGQSFGTRLPLNRAGE